MNYALKIASDAMNGAMNEGGGGGSMAAHGIEDNE